MGFTSFLKSPKKEEQHEVPDNYGNNTTKYGHTNTIGDQEVDIMDDLERLLGINDDDDDLGDQNNKPGKTINSWGFMGWDDFREFEDEEDESSSLLLEDEDEREHKLFGNKDIISTKCFFEEEGYTNGTFHNTTTTTNNFINNCYSNEESSVVKREVVGFWDEDYTRVSLNLSLNHQEVLDAWSGRGSLWADHDYSMATNGYMGEVPIMEEERARREASVMRYKEKRQTRLFSKKIRYEVRKLNADKRPRLKGRFVKRVS